MGFEEKLVWKTPELIVLVRNKAEEAVLAACKNSGSSGTPNTLNTGCGELKRGNCHACKQTNKS